MTEREIHDNVYIHDERMIIMEHKEMLRTKPYIRECHAFNLRQANLAVTALYDRHMKKAGITIQQYSILRHVRDFGPVSITDLSEVMHLDRTTVSRNLSLLERRHFVENAPSPGRKKLIRLTTEGMDAYSEASSYWQEAQDELESRIGKTKMMQLEQLLLQLIE
ncbi:MAG: Transcriptional regulator [Acidaminococcus timonensis]